MDLHGKRNIKDTSDTIVGCLSSYCLSDELADVHFSFLEQTGHMQKISAHKMILAFRSPVFKVMFYGTFPQTEGDIEITDINPETFLVFKRYIYTDELELNEKTTFPLLYAGQKYQVLSLLSKCETYLSENLDVHNACSIFAQAKFFSLHKLETEALQYIAKNAAKCFGSDSFLKLSSKNLKDILELDSLCLKEIEIFQAGLKWADHKLLNVKQTIDGQNRRGELIQDGILYTIGMPLLNLQDFTKTVVPSGILTDEEQLYVFKSITMKGSPDSQGLKFRRIRRKGSEIVSLNIDKCLPPNCGGGGIPFHFNNSGQMMETLNLKTNKALKIVSISFKPNLLAFRELHTGQINPTFTICIDNNFLTGGTYENDGTSCSEINYFISPNELIAIEVVFQNQCWRNLHEEKRAQRVIEKRARRHKLSTAKNYDQRPSFSWTEKGQKILEFDTCGRRLVETIEMVEA